MSGAYDIFLSHSGAQKGFVEDLNTELKRYGRFSVFFDKESIQNGEQISSTILEHAKTCKLAVVVLSEEYFTRSRPPMMELAASYAAAKHGNGMPRLFPVFCAIKPQHAKDYKRRMGWEKKWQEWDLNEKMSEGRDYYTSRIEIKVWKEALDALLDILGPVYMPHKYNNNPGLFMKDVAQQIADLRLDGLSRQMVPSKVEERMQQPKMKTHVVPMTFLNSVKNRNSKRVVGEGASSENPPSGFRKGGVGLKGKEKVDAELSRETQATPGLGKGNLVQKGKLKIDTQGFTQVENRIRSHFQKPLETTKPAGKTTRPKPLAGNPFQVLDDHCEDVHEDDNEADVEISPGIVGQELKEGRTPRELEEEIPQHEEDGWYNLRSKRTAEKELERDKKPLSTNFRRVQSFPEELGISSGLSSRKQTPLLDVFRRRSISERRRSISERRRSISERRRSISERRSNVRNALDESIAAKEK